MLRVGDRRARTSTQKVETMSVTFTDKVRQRSIVGRAELEPR